MNKTIIGIAIGVLTLGSLIWLARPKPTSEGGIARLNGQNTPSVTASSNESLTVEETNNYDFGSISMVAGKVKHTFKIKNTRSEAVTISKMYTSCMCTTAVLNAGGRQFGPYGMPGHDAIPKINQNIRGGEE